LNTEIDSLSMRDGRSYSNVLIISDAQIGKTISWPYIAIYPQETSLVNKWGRRKQWQYQVVVEIAHRCKDGDSRQLERDMEIYLEAIENVIDDNETLSGEVWEATVSNKRYSTVVEMDRGLLAQTAQLIIEVDQTN